MTSSDLAELKSIFRAELSEDPDKGFDRDAQLRIVVARLAHMRTTWPDLWSKVHATLDRGSLAGPEHRGVREFKQMISRDIRAACESMDHLATVCFVSAKVAHQLLNERKRRLNRGQLKSKSFGHEHCVPGDVVLRIVVDPKNEHADLFQVMSALGQRALLHREEISLLDRSFKTSLPLSITLKTEVDLGTRTLPFRWFGLARYYAADPEMTAGLIPLTQRSGGLFREFQAMVMRGLPAPQENNLCYLPDNVIP